ncbi:MAG: hypothetical protein K8T10_10510 [Candidatus Eremiobacteraeota bacterium]|nr:hypothetical protein [Candidatus Eremiobacteraeota bacterium]
MINKKQFFTLSLVIIFALMLVSFFTVKINANTFEVGAGTYLEKNTVCDGNCPGCPTPCPSKNAVCDGNCPGCPTPCPSKNAVCDGNCPGCPTPCPSKEAVCDGNCPGCPTPCPSKDAR